MYQKLIIVGNLGRDPELRYTPQGSPVANFSLAVNRRDKEGGDHVTWFKIVAWGSLAEACNQYLSKGRQVLVEGTLNPDTDGHPRVWTASDGTVRASYEVRALSVQFLGGGRQEEEMEQEAEAEQGELPF